VLNPYPELNSRDTFRATTQGTTTTRPLRYPKSLVDHARRASKPNAVATKSPGATRNALGAAHF